MGFPNIWKILFQDEGNTRILSSSILPNATGTSKGAVLLSDKASSSGVANSVAATPKAVNDSINGSAVKYSASQALTDAQKEQARNNIGAPNASSVVTLSTTQTISGSKTFSASPIVPNLATTDNSTKAASTKFVQDVVNAKALRIDSVQSLTTAQKEQLRDAIGAVADGEVIHNTGAETIKGIKTFESSPYAPTPAKEDNSTKVATTAFVKANAYVHPTTAGNKHIPAGGSSGQILRWSAAGTAVWGADNNTTYTNFVKSGSGAKAGLVPAPSTTAGTTKYLREDGTWQVPPDTNTDTDTKNTAGSTNSTAKLFLIGATSQAANPQTYSFKDTYIQNGAFTTSGAVKGASFQATSDIRKKENLKEIKNINLTSLGTYSYNFKDDKEHRKVGLIAQEVEKICPEAVTTDEDGFKSLDYNAVVALLVAKVNELEKKYGK